ncbi:MAG: ribulose-phosphate 3-epimerase [Gammaproteobacteria bacterium]|nr:ribulose-phosphate 3-epimerase [Gammaproteobacteria bacterium]
MRDSKISASILAADFANLGQEVTQVIEAGADFIHFDVMDNHYVPCLTVGPMVCSALRKYGITAPIDVHLMVKPVDALIVEFAKAGATYITIHPEATEHLDRSLQLIKDLGCKAGLAFNPSTPLEYLEYVLERLDLVLVMSVNPGFGGQEFLPSMLRKIRQVHHIIQDCSHPIRLEVDGGIKINNIADIANEGADTFVVGTGIFHSDNYQTTIARLRAELNKVTH